MPEDRGEESGRERCALLEYRKRERRRVPAPLFTGRLPAATIAPLVIAMRPHDHHPARMIIARLNDDQRSGMIRVVVGAVITRVIRPANHDLPGEVWIAETQ